MIPNIPDHVRDRLSEYEAAVVQIEEHFSRPESTARFLAGPAYREKHRIAALIGNLPEGVPEKREIQDRYDQLMGRLSVLELQIGSELRESLLCELRYRVDTWHSVLCHRELCTLGSEEALMIIDRETIAGLLAELRHTSDLTGIERMVRELDESTRSMDTCQEPFSSPFGNPRRVNAGQGCIRMVIVEERSWFESIINS
jgi:hypothetical protein